MNVRDRYAENEIETNRQRQTDKRKGKERGGNPDSQRRITTFSSVLTLPPPFPSPQRNIFALFGSPKTAPLYSILKPSIKSVTGH